MYFDTHAHYDDARYDADRDSLLAAMPAAGIEYIVNVGADMPSTKKAVALAEQYTYVYASAGVHPHETGTMTQADLDHLEALTAHPKVVAVGEIGLDYYYDHAPRAQQQFWFAKQLALAERTQLPVIIHSRDAVADTFDIIAKSNVRQGVVHCYAGNTEMAMAYVGMGYYIGVGGVVTFSNAKKLVEVVKALPLEHIVIETDCPYLSPTPNRGQRNDSRNLIYIVEKIASIKNMDPAKVASITRENAFSLYRISVS